MSCNLNNYVKRIKRPSNEVVWFDIVNNSVVTDPVLLAELEAALVAEDCESDFAGECSEGSGGSTTFSHSTVNNTTDLSFSMNSTLLKLTWENTPFNSPDAAPFIASVKECIDAGNSVDMVMTDPSGDTASFTANSYSTANEPQQTDFFGNSVDNDPSSGKVTMITGNCIKAAEPQKFLYHGWTQCDKNWYESVQLDWIHACLTDGTDFFKGFYQFNKVTGVKTGEFRDESMESLTGVSVAGDQCKCSCVCEPLGDGEFPGEIGDQTTCASRKLGADFTSSNSGEATHNVGSLVDTNGPVIAWSGTFVVTDNAGGTFTFNDGDTVTGLASGATQSVAFTGWIHWTDGTDEYRCQVTDKSISANFTVL